MTRAPVVLLALVATLVMATSASSRTASGEVSVSPRRVMVLPYYNASPVTAYIMVAAASWSPPTVRTEGGIYVYSCGAGVGNQPCRREGDPQTFGFGSGGAVLHSSESYAGLFAGYAGERYELTARWRAYTPLPAGFFDGEKTSDPMILKVPEGLPPRFADSTKLYLADSGIFLYASCESLTLIGASASVPGLGEPATAIGGLACGSGLGMNQMAFDPVDSNFRTIAKPKIPAVPKISAGGLISAGAAAAFNKLLAAQAREIGYGRAVITSINRAQGANAKKQTAWEKKQMRAAGTYAAPLAAALLDDVRLRTALVRALDDPDLADVTISDEDFFAFQDALIRKGMPTGFAPVLSRAGLSKAEQQQIHGWLLATDVSRVVGDPLARIADPKLTASLRKSAAALKAFAKKAARNPLDTRT